jgi:hypothetical protein
MMPSRGKQHDSSDLRDDFIRVKSAARGFGSFQADAFKSHTHLVRWKYNGANNGTGVLVGYDDTSGTSSSACIASTGSTETRPRNVALPAFVQI